MNPEQDARRMPTDTIADQLAKAADIILSRSANWRVGDRDPFEVAAHELAVAYVAAHDADKWEEYHRQFSLAGPMITQLRIIEDLRWSAMSKEEESVYWQSMYSQNDKLIQELRDQLAAVTRERDDLLAAHDAGKGATTRDYAEVIQKKLTKDAQLKANVELCAEITQLEQKLAAAHAANCQLKEQLSRMGISPETSIIEAGRQGAETP